LATLKSAPGNIYPKYSIIEHSSDKRVENSFRQSTFILVFPDIRFRYRYPLLIMSKRSENQKCSLSLIPSLLPTKLHAMPVPCLPQSCFDKSHVPLTPSTEYTKQHYNRQDSGTWSFVLIIQDSLSIDNGTSAFPADKTQKPAYSFTVLHRL